MTALTHDPASFTTDLPILHRDERLLAVAKPAGMIVHRGWGDDRVTVADLAREAVGAPVNAVHRLDRGTSGVLLFALDAAAARHVQGEFEAGRVAKEYLALVRGPMREGCTVDHPVPRCREKEAERVPAVTEFEPLAHQGRWSLVAARPRTGRLHQIRRHLKHLSHPIVGDVNYGKGDVNRHFRTEYGLHRLALHAHRLALCHPDGRRLEFEAPLPPDLCHTLQALGMWPLAGQAAPKPC